ncbi:MAG: hypothetical protein ABIV48_02140 [Pyrinomonadaceae bacterium]
MKEDYLWNKTGTDPEIERLENFLSEYRYQGTDVPLLPSEIRNIVTDAPKCWNLSFSFALAFSAFAAVVIGVGIWFQFIGSTAISPVLIAESPVSGPIKLASTENIVNRPAIIKTEKTSPQPVKTVLRSKESKPRTNIARVPESKKAQVVLSQEEKYAYSQLMLALAITSEKLKVVGDTINRTDEGKNVNQTNNR